METKTQEKTFSVNVQYQIKQSDIESLLTSAFEGGSNYWYFIEKAVRPTFKESFGESLKYTYFSDYIFNGGYLRISDRTESGEKDKKTITMTKASISLGLELMAKNSHGHFADIIKGATDGETGDIFLQYCLFGKVIYG